MFGGFSESIGINLRPKLVGSCNCAVYYKLKSKCLLSLWILMMESALHICNC